MSIAQGGRPNNAIMQKRGILFNRDGIAGQAGTDRASAVASSSNAVEMSRMLTTPIRL